VSCSDFPRDNVLDPKNPNSYQSSVVLLEAFVNTNNPFPYNLWTLEALDSIKSIYGSNAVIIEYHQDTQQFTDPYSNTLIFEPLYEKYVQNSTPNVKGVPDVFIMGSGQRVQGASSTNSVLTRLNSILTPLVVLNTYYTLEPANINISGNQLSMSCKVARLGNQSAANLSLRAILLRQVNSQELKRVALDIVKADNIARLEAGEIRTVDFDPFEFIERPDWIIFSLTSSNELMVYQNIKVNL
jgi:hypothetical protein